MITVVSAMEAGKNTLKAPKTIAGIRKVPIADDIYYKLLELRGEPFSPVFLQPKNGNRHTETSRALAWKSMLKVMDDSMGAKWQKVKTKDGKMRNKKILSVVAPDLVPYCLRHTFCTDLQTKGVTLKVASYLMGHTDITVTANIYTHMTDGILNETALLMGVGRNQNYVRNA